VKIDSEQEMLGYGISIVLLNIGMYIGIPLFGILKLYQFRKN
ncbi:MAG: copper-binding protein, partial [Nitrosopumilus sp.]|nr:copper-binding protein [Nitrosopumilus sp.]